MDDATGGSVRDEWARGWSAVMVGLAGMALTGIAVHSIGLLMAPLELAFGWTRTEISSGLFVFAAVALVVTPLVGRLVDTVGPKWVAIPGTLLMGCTFSVFAFANGSLVQWWVLWFFFAVAATSANPMIWVSLVSRIFVAGRGLAIGVMMCGAALSVLIIPSLTRWSIDSFGWRAAYPIVGLSFSIVTCLLVVIFVQDRGGHSGKGQEGDGPAVAASDPLEGLSFSEAMRNPAVLKIVISVFLIMVLFVALIVHMIPILTDGGIDRTGATLLASGLGIGSVIGKLGIGWIADRGRARRLSAFCFALPGLACLLLLVAKGNVLVAAAAILVVSLGSGSVLQLSAYLTSRYVGLRSFGQVYGLISGLMGVAGGLGPLLSAVVFDRAASYAPLLIGGIPVAIVIGLIVATLGPYPDFTRAKSRGQISS